MATAAPLMPKATAVWLLDNTALSFDQIAEFCKLHPLEVKAIADGDAAQGIKGLDPILTGQLTRDQIAEAEKNPEVRLKLTDPKVAVPPPDRGKKGPRYTPVSRRQDRPNAILWLVRNHPELKDSAIMRLVGTTKSTIASIRDRTHWNSANLAPMDPVTRKRIKSRARWTSALCSPSSSSSAAKATKKASDRRVNFRRLVLRKIRCNICA
jgi:hypothetical protein